MKLEQFLVLTKQNTYASSAEGIETIQPDRSKELTYQAESYRGCLVEGDLEYLDESIGSVEQFSGAEKILYQGHEIYRLDYHGGLISAE